MSRATFRHVNALSMKYELLREIKHWKQSCNKCINDITNNIKSLRVSRADVKREIHEARARLEERLKELEECSEKQMNEMVANEEETLKNFVKKLADRQKRMELTESTLKDNVVGFKLKRAIEEGKHQAIAIREAMLDVRKYNMAAAVDFKLKEPLYSITELLDSLGTVTLLAASSNEVRKKTLQKSGDLESKTTTSESEVSLDTFLTTDDENRSASIEETMMNDLEFVLEMDTKYGHSLKPFLDSIKDISLKYNCNQTAKKETVHPPTKQTSPKVIEYEQKPKSVLRTQSAKNGGINGHRIHTRLSKSAKEEGRNARGDNLCLNNVDVPYAPFEEQGPESKEVKGKRALSVRYHDFDFVKEITAIKDETEEQAQKGAKLFSSIISSDGEITEIARLQSPGSQSTASTTLSSVSYKPSSSLASGPVYITPSDLRKSNSFFNYVARFHTKKHPYETDLCRLTSIVALDNGQIVVSDINHLQLMLFGPDFTYLDSLECPSPCGLGKVSENTVAVTLFHNRKVMQVKVHTIHLVRYKDFNIPCQEPLFTVSYRDGRYFVLCFAGDIHVLDDDGRQLTILETGINAGEGRHMDIDERAKFIFISGHDRVSCLTDSGEKLWQYTCSTYHKRFTPSDIVFHNNRLFVADWSGHKVLELTTEGSHVRDVVNDDIEYPHAMTVQKSYGRLFITQSNFFKQEARSRTIKIKLEQNIVKTDRLAVKKTKN